MATEISAEIVSSSTSTPLSVPSAEEISNSRAVESEGFSVTLYKTVDPYHRHIFLVYKKVEDWASAPIIEEFKNDSLPRILAAALRSHASEMRMKTRMTICEGPSGTDSNDGDVFVFPEMARYRGLTNNNADNFVRDVLVDGKDWVSEPARLNGSYVFVCSHASPHKRYDVCGPKLINRFYEEIGSRRLKDRVFVGPCSHDGGCRYPGNLIIFNCNATGLVTGNWYGCVTPADVPAMLDKHILKQELIKKLWRGEMLVLPTEDGQKAVKNKPRRKRTSTDGEGSSCQDTSGVSGRKDGRVEKTAEPKRTSGISGRKDGRVENTTKSKRTRKSS